MAYAMQTIDLSSLPDRVQAELMDFYHFLVSKYGEKKTKEDTAIQTGLPAEFYNPIKVKKYYKFNREDIYQDG